jgi:hypothetical protein
MFKSIIKFSAVAAVAAMAIIGTADARGNGGGGGGGGSSGGGAGGGDAAVIAAVPSSVARRNPSTFPPNDRPRNSVGLYDCPDHLRNAQALYCTNR